MLKPDYKVAKDRTKVEIKYQNVDEKIKVVKYLQEKGTFKVKGAIVLVAEKLAVSEPTVYRYLKKNV